MVWGAPAKLIPMDSLALGVNIGGLGCSFQANSHGFPSSGGEYWAPPAKLIPMVWGDPSKLIPMVWGVFPSSGGEYLAPPAQAETVSSIGPSRTYLLDLIVECSTT